jgi:hypothetical protein
MQISASPDSPLLSEKRRCQRHPQDLDANLLDSGSRPAGEAVRLTDMSTVGLGIESNQELRVGDRLDFRMSVDEGRTMSATARVRWSRPSGFSTAYGLELEGLGYYDRGRLQRFLNPKFMGVEEWATLLLQAASTMMGIYVAYDWIISDPARVQTAVFLLPWLMYAAAVLIMGYFSKHRI